MVKAVEGSTRGGMPNEETLRSDTIGASGEIPLAAAISETDSLGSLTDASSWLTRMSWGLSSRMLFCDVLRTLTSFSSST